MLSWKKYEGLPLNFYLGRIFEMTFHSEKVELVDGCEAFSEEVSPEEAKRLLQQAIDLIDDHYHIQK